MAHLRIHEEGRPPMFVTFELSAEMLRKIIVEALSAQTKGLHLDWAGAEVTATTRAGRGEAEELYVMVEVSKEDE